MPTDIVIKGYGREKLKRVNESVQGGSKNIDLEGVFGVVSDTPNRNGRIYTEETYLPHIKDIRDRLSRGETIYGELDHPDDRFEIKVEKASHMILDVHYDKNSKKVMGKIRLLDTPSGRIAKALLEAGGNVYVSSRAQGYELDNGKLELTQIMTWDIVATPGFSEAVVHRVNESAQVNSLQSFVRDKYEEYKRIVSPKTNYKVIRINENEDYIRIAKPIKEEKTIDQARLDNNEEGGRKMDEFYVDNTRNADSDTEVVELSDEAISRIADELEKRLGNSLGKGGSESDSDNPFIESKVEIASESELTDAEKEALGSDDNVFETEDIKVVSEDGLTNDEKDALEANAGDKNDDEDEDESEPEEVDVEDEVESFLNNVKKDKQIKESLCNRHPWARDLQPINRAIFEGFDRRKQDEVASRIYEMSEGDISFFLDENAINESFDVITKQMSSPDYTKTPRWVALGGKDVLESYNALPKDIREEVNRQSEIIVLDTTDQVRSFWRDLKREKIIVESKKFVPSRLNESKSIERADHDPADSLILEEEQRKFSEDILRELGL
nr:MAG TPA: Prohead core protein serine protease [Caudoviricetes sp.]